jgi:CheY-like chemotaxis protein
MSDERPVLVVGPQAPGRRLAEALSASGYRTVLSATPVAVDPPGAVAGVVVVVGADAGPGLDAVRAVDDRAPATPVVAYAADGGEALARDALRAGADDYVADPAAVPERVAATVEGPLREVEADPDDDRGLAQMIAESPLAVVGSAAGTTPPRTCSATTPPRRGAATPRFWCPTRSRTRWRRSGSASSRRAAPSAGSTRTAPPTAAACCASGTTPRSGTTTAR